MVTRLVWYSVERCDSTMFILPDYIVPAKTINGFYSIEEALCILLILLVIIVSIFEVKQLVKFTVTILSLITIGLHYYLLAALSAYESITFLPLFYIEASSKGSVLALDYGQIIVVGLIYLWRKQLIGGMYRLRLKLQAK
jgi:hypothetical protein